MSLGKFLLFTTMGTAIWSAVLGYAGVFLGEILGRHPGDCGPVRARDSGGINRAGGPVRRVSPARDAPQQGTPRNAGADLRNGNRHKLLPQSFQPGLPDSHRAFFDA